MPWVSVHDSETSEHSYRSTCMINNGYKGKNHVKSGSLAPFCATCHDSHGVDQGLPSVYGPLTHIHTHTRIVLYEMILICIVVMLG